jgi:UDP-perosamine 4-acetyltransferase
MNKRPDIIVVGAGGHGRVLADVLRRAGETVAAFVDVETQLHGKDLDGVPIIGGDDAILARTPGDVVLVNGRGNVPRLGTSGLGGRRGIYERFRERGFSFMRVISPDAYVSSSAVLEDACQIITGAIVHAGAVIGRNVIVNTGAQIDHDCRIGDHAHIAPGAVLCGNVTVGSETQISAGVVVIPKITIGAGAIVGAGAVIVADVAAGETTFGVASRSAR